MLEVNTTTRNISRTKDSASALVDKRASSPVSNTLAEKAAAYRASNPQKWTDRRRQSAEEYEKSKLEEMDPFLKSYYDKISLSVKEQHAREAERQKEPRKLKVWIRYGSAKMNLAETASIDSDNTFDLSKTGFDLKSILHEDSKSDNSDKPLVDSELIINVVAGTNFHNGIANEAHRMKKATVRALLCPECETRSSKLKTGHRYLTSEGETRFDTKFLFKGLTKEELSSRYCLLRVDGDSSEGRVLLGHAVISGANALIKTGDEDRLRKPTEEEALPLQEALKTPGTTVHAYCNLTAEDFPCDSTSPLKALKHGSRSRTKSLPFILQNDVALNQSSNSTNSQCGATKRKQVKKVSSFKKNLSRRFRLSLNL